jgi:hypothetical protein
MRCGERITLQPRQETYCMRELGHAGEHSIEAGKQDVRCPATHEGKRCSQPLGHFGQHHVATGAVNYNW